MGETDEFPSARELWEAALGKVFKQAVKQYGVRTVTYTQVKAVRPAAQPDEFEIEVLCVEIIARVLSGKRTHSSICKEGVLHQLPGSELLPESFGAECAFAEFEKVAGAILAYTSTYLDWVAQDSPEETTEISVPIDLPHLRLTDMEASLVRNSPFLVKDVYILTPNSIRAALASIHEELGRASRNMHLSDAVDSLYVERKNDAVTSLHAKLKEAQAAAAASRKDTARAALELDSLTLALLGRPSATALRWLTANPSEEGAIYTLGLQAGPLDFVRWAHVSGRAVSPETTAGHVLRSYFRGFNDAYTGPDRDGIYPLLRPATE